MRTYFFVSEIVDKATNDVYDYSYTVDSMPERAFYDAKGNIKRWIKANLPNVKEYEIFVLTLNPL